MDWMWLICAVAWGVTAGLMACSGVAWARKPGDKVLYFGIALGSAALSVFYVLRAVQG